MVASSSRPDDGRAPLRHASLVGFVGCLVLLGCVGRYGVHLPVRRLATVPIRILEPADPSFDGDRLHVRVEATLPGSFAATIGPGDKLSIRRAADRLVGVVETVEPATPSSALEAPSRAGESRAKLHVRLRIVDVPQDTAIDEPMWLEAEGPTERLYEVLLRGTPLEQETT